MWDQNNPELAESSTPPKLIPRAAQPINSMTQVQRKEAFPQNPSTPPQEHAGIMCAQFQPSSFNGVVVGELHRRIMNLAP